MRGRLVRGLVVAMLAVVAAGCGDDDDPAADSSTTEPAAASTTSTEPPTVADTTPEDGDALPDGEHFGYLVELEATDGTYEGTFDLAYLYTGNEAISKAAEDGLALETEFYIRNENPKLRAVELDPAAEVRDIDSASCCEPRDVTVAEFVLARDEQGEERTAVNLTVVGGLVTEVEEQYLP